jgi:hypothetical protein
VEANAAAADLRLAPDELAHLTAAADRFHASSLAAPAPSSAGACARPATRRG